MGDEIKNDGIQENPNGGKAENPIGGNVENPSGQDGKEITGGAEGEKTGAAAQKNTERTDGPNAEADEKEKTKAVEANNTEKKTTEVKEEKKSEDTLWSKFSQYLPSLLTGFITVNFFTLIENSKWKYLNGAQLENLFGIFKVSYYYIPVTLLLVLLIVQLLLELKKRGESLKAYMLLAFVLTIAFAWLYSLIIWNQCAPIGAGFFYLTFNLVFAAFYYKINARVNELNSNKFSREPDGKKNRQQWIPNKLFFPFLIILIICPFYTVFLINPCGATGKDVPTNTLADACFSIQERIYANTKYTENRQMLNSILQDKIKLAEYSLNANSKSELLQYVDRSHYKDYLQELLKEESKRYRNSINKNPEDFMINDFPEESGKERNLAFWRYHSDNMNNDANFYDALNNEFKNIYSGKEDTEVAKEKQQTSNAKTKINVSKIKKVAELTELSSLIDFYNVLYDRENYRMKKFYQPFFERFIKDLQKNGIILLAVLMSIMTLLILCARETNKNNDNSEADLDRTKYLKTVFALYGIMLINIISPSLQGEYNLDKPGWMYNLSGWNLPEFAMSAFTEKPKEPEMDGDGIIDNKKLDALISKLSAIENSINKSNETLSKISKSIDSNHTKVKDVLDTVKYANVDFVLMVAKHLKENSLIKKYEEKSGQRRK